MNKGSSKPRVALIAGPTASGKSALAVNLAEPLRGTIVNADSAQVYRDLRVLTARPSPDEEARVPHQLFGHVDGADGGYSAARWAVEARAAVNEVLAGRGLPILVGGTGLYLRTLLDGIAPVPPIDPAVREEVRALPLAAAHTQLAALDPSAAASLHPHDATRIARALEVIRSTGRTLADWQGERVGGIGNAIDVAALILTPPREKLVAAIDARSAAMLEAGALDEVAALLARPDVPDDAPIRRAIGVPPLAAYLEGRVTLGEALARLQLDTRQYAKRQATWFRHQPPVGWRRSADPADAAEQLATLLL